LWDLVWANVLTRAAAHQDWSQVFPWLAPTPTSEKGQVFTEEMAHPLHAFFGMPRRLRLRFDGAGHVTGYGTKPWGINYTGWSHPLSPYYKSPQGAWLPLHARSGPPSWRDWPSLWALSPDEKAKRAGTVESFVATRRRHLPEESTHQTVLAAFGYDMDNMKALRWVSFVAPWLPGLDADNGAEHARMMSALIKGGEEGASALRLAVRVAHYGVRDREGRYSVPDTVKRDGGIDPTPEFWAVTEAAFREAVQGFADRAGDEDHATRLTFLAALKREARDLFTEYTDEESLAEGDPERTLQALALLHAAFTPWGKVATALGVGIAKPKDKKVRA
jgi:CRISPR system Cascade subunit CasA